MSFVGSRWWKQLSYSGENMHHRAVCGYQMNSTFLLAASSEAFNLCWLLYCISDVIWRGGTSSCSKAPVSGFSRCACCSGQAVPWQHWKQPLQRLSGGCTKPLEGVEALDSVSDLLLLRIFPFVCEHLWMEMTFGPTERTYGTMDYRNIPGFMLSLGSWWEKNQQSSLLTFWPFYKDAFHKDDYLPRYRQSSVSKVGSSTGCGEIGCDCWELNTKAELWIQSGLCQQGNDLVESFYFNRLTDQEKTKELFFFFSKHLWLFSSFSSMIPLLGPYHWLK